MWVLEKTEGRANYKIHCVLCMFRIQPISSHKPYIRVDISQITSYTGADRGGGGSGDGAVVPPLAGQTEPLLAII